MDNTFREWHTPEETKSKDEPTQLTCFTMSERTQHRSTLYSDSVIIMDQAVGVKVTELYFDQFR